MKRIGMAFTLRAGKYSPLNNDKGLKRISLEKWNGINKDTLFWTYRNEFIVHKRTPALTLTTTKLYPDTLIKYGIKTETRKATGENNVTGMLYYKQQEKSSKKWNSWCSHSIILTKVFAHYRNRDILEWVGRRSWAFWRSSSLFNRPMVTNRRTNQNTS